MITKLLFAVFVALQAFDGGITYFAVHNHVTEEKNGLAAFLIDKFGCGITVLAFKLFAICVAYLIVKRFYHRKVAVTTWLLMVILPYIWVCCHNFNVVF